MFKRMLWLWWCWVAMPALSYSSRMEPHFFNAHLIPRHKGQISIYGNAKAGVNNELEIGTHAVSLLRLYNLSVKHQMFDLAKAKTSFTSHTFFYLPEKGETAITTLWGITTSWLIQSGWEIFGGPFDLMLLTKGHRSSISDTHIFSAVIGSDAEVTRGITFTAFALLPIWGGAEMNQDYGDLEAQVHFLKAKRYPGLLFASFTKHWDVFHLEAGAFSLTQNTKPIPYLNLYWRW
jgi:hypothetical protein